MTHISTTIGKTIMSPVHMMTVTEVRTFQIATTGTAMNLTTTGTTTGMMMTGVQTMTGIRVIVGTPEAIGILTGNKADIL